MRITIGRGRNRKSIDLPCGSMVAQAAKEDPETHRRNIQTICAILRVA